MGPSSTVFSIEGKGLRFDSAADLEPHLKPLLDSTDQITEVRFGGNTYGVDACELLGKVLRSQKSLHTANLADIFTSRLLSEIPPALSSLLGALLDVHTLQTVDLSDNAFGLNTQAPLVHFLESHLPLRHLILNNNGLGPEAGARIAAALTELCARKRKAREGTSVSYEIPYLETIVCGRNRLENGSMSAWARAVKDNGKGLRVVKMTQNGIRQPGIRVLLDAGLRHAPDLQILDLQDNTFTIMASRVLAEVVLGWPELRELGVGDCLLTGRGGLKVFEALHQGENKLIEVLRLGFNEITAAGVEELLHAARDSMPKLKRIELNGNKFEEDDSNIVALRELFEERKKAHGKEDDDEEWGLDELDELEEESDEEEEDEEEEESEESEAESTAEKKAEKILQGTAEEENEKVAQKADKDVDELAAKLKQTSV